MENTVCSSTLILSRKVQYIRRSVCNQELVLVEKRVQMILYDVLRWWSPGLNDIFKIQS